MRVCLCWLVLAVGCLHAASAPKSETGHGKLLVSSGEAPVVETVEHQRIVLDGDTPTRKVLHDPRVNGFEVEARGHFTAPGRLLIDPQHTRPLLVRDGARRSPRRRCVSFPPPPPPPPPFFGSAMAAS